MFPLTHNIVAGAVGRLGRAVLIHRDGPGTEPLGPRRSFESFERAAAAHGNRRSLRNLAARDHWRMAGRESGPFSTQSGYVHVRIPHIHNEHSVHTQWELGADSACSSFTLSGQPWHTRWTKHAQYALRIHPVETAV